MDSLVSWDDHLNNKYGKEGTPTRNKYEEEFEAFKLGFLLQEARKKKHLTQEELAFKTGTTKNYISRLENNTAGISLSTLSHIIKVGLGGTVKL